VVLLVLLVQKETMVGREAPDPKVLKALKALQALQALQALLALQGTRGI